MGHGSVGRGANVLATSGTEVKITFAFQGGVYVSCPNRSKRA